MVTDSTSILNRGAPEAGCLQVVVQPVFQYVMLLPINRIRFGTEPGCGGGIGLHPLNTSAISTNKDNIHL